MTFYYYFVFSGFSMAFVKNPTTFRWKLGQAIKINFMRNYLKIRYIFSFFFSYPFMIMKERSNINKPEL